MYSSAQYGYADNLPVAVAANAAYQEIGFDGFEEYSTANLYDSEYTGHGTLNFQCPEREEQITTTFNVLGAYDGGTTIWIDKEGYDNMPLPDQALLVLQDENGNEYETTADVTAITALDPSSINGLATYFKDQVTKLSLDQIDFCTSPGSLALTGRVVLAYNIQYNEIPSDGLGCGGRAITTAEAHTGRHSLEINASTTFEQKELHLIDGRNYILSAWVKSSSTNPAFTYEGNGAGIDVAMNGGTETFQPSGPMIEGWQRIEGVFTYNSGSDLSFTLRPSGATNYYFDDIRIYPEDGSIQTYVYNPEDYRLQAVMDQNNYATFYHYDEEGNLFLIKKETAKGIKTIQETREYVIDRLEE